MLTSTGYTFLFFQALAWTLVIELAILALLRHLWFGRVGLVRTLMVGALATAATLPWIWFIFPEIITDRTALIAVSELFALMFETGVFCLALNISLKLAFTLSLACNAVSFLAGVLFSLP